MPRERAGVAVLDTELPFVTGRSFADGCAGDSLVIESVECKEMLLMMVFKQVQVANGTNVSLRMKNKRAGSTVEDARQGTPAREGVKWKVKPSWRRHDVWRLKGGSVF